MLDLNPDYIAGFVDGEGCFCVAFCKTNRPLCEVRLMFEIELRADDEPTLRRIQQTLDCGNIYRLEYARYAKWQSHVKLKVSNFEDIYTKVIPFFKANPLQAKKRFDFVKFCLIADMMKRKEHLTLEGVDRIREIKHKDSLDALDTHVQWGAAEIT